MSKVIKPDTKVTGNTPAERMANLRAAMKKDVEWFRSNKDLLMTNYEGEWVAIRDGEIKFHTKDRRKMMEKIEADIGRCCMKKVEEDSFRKKEDWEIMLPTILSHPPPEMDKS